MGPTMMLLHLLRNVVVGRSGICFGIVKTTPTLNRSNSADRGHRHLSHSGGCLENRAVAVA